MKYPHLCLFFICCISGMKVFTQEYKKSAENQFLQYTDFIIRKDFRKAAAFVIDDIFTIIPKEQMISAMEKVFNMAALKYIIDSPKVINVSNARKLEAHYYLKLKYAHILRIQFDADAAATDSSLVENEWVTLSLQSRFGRQNVRYDSQTGYYNIYSEKDVIAKSANLKNWKFIVVEENEIPFLKKIIPKEMLE